ncbi:MAG: hypothetical protein LBO20_04465, partial [Bifidobacteriaceae bacterium]|nr:hypothetical protein [Bifidobacteriaceae bacterium]
LPEVAVFADAEDLSERRDSRRRRIADRRRRRRQSHQAAYDTWAVLAGWRDPQAAPETPSSTPTAVRAAAHPEGA